MEAADRAEGEATIVDEGLDKNLFCANKKSDLIKGKKLLWMKKAKAIKKKSMKNVNSFSLRSKHFKLFDVAVDFDLVYFL